MSKSSLAFRILAPLLSLALFAVSGGLVYAATDDYMLRSTFPAGVKAHGTEIGGLDRDAAYAAIQENVAAPFFQPLTVRFQKRTFQLPSEKYLSIDIEGMLEEAYDVKWSPSLPQRVRTRVTGEPVSADIPVRLDVDEEKVGGWVARLAKKIDKRSVDATRVIEGTKLIIKPAKNGYRVSTEGTAKRVTAALVEETRTVEAKVKTLKPKVTARTWKKTIIVSRAQRRLYLYKYDKLEKTYPIAVGTPGYPTPKGWWTIVNKRYLPTWRNPGSAWATGMPAYIGPGPGNPLGTRALDLNASGIRIHGTSNNASIGTAASHGCMRMHMWDIEDLYPRVPVGTTCVIVD